MIDPFLGIFEMIWWVWPQILLSILMLLISLSVEVLVSRRLRKRGHVVNFYAKAFIVVVTYMMLLIGFVIVSGAVSSGGLASFLGGRPLPFIKLFFGF